MTSGKAGGLSGYDLERLFIAPKALTLQILVGRDVRLLFLDPEDIPLPYLHPVLQ